MLKKIINAVIKRTRTKLYSFKYNIGKSCSFQNIKIYADKKGLKIGHNVIILRHTELCGNSNLPIIIGNNTFINQKCIIRPNVTIGNNVDIAPEVLLISDTHEIGDSNKRAGRSIFPPIHIEDGCWIGARVTILGNVTIGKGTIIAANSLVNKDCEPNCIYGGVPAKLIKRLDP
ncbi:acyltransferase [Clostridium sp. OS1-26]|uniref:acyltransferase n=1 Tax=Clostridium sp. OS1-26 TaxID=3070681 RepID=UPI0027DFEF9B|nr:acyltransferase [Clostridium sp. OS1-26]WML36807.1 acyltransferase [Clostridium sp. OS1-26]